MAVTDIDHLKKNDSEYQKFEKINEFYKKKLSVSTY